MLVVSTVIHPTGNRLAKNFAVWNGGEIFWLFRMDIFFVIYGLNTNELYQSLYDECTGIVFDNG